MISNRKSRAKVNQAEKSWIAKFVLRPLTIADAIIAFGLAGHSYSLSYDLEAIWISIPLGISFSWNIANVIVQLCRARPMRSDAYVGMDLVI